MRTYWLFCVIILVAAGISKTQAIVLHPNNEPAPYIKDRPDPNVLGRWSSNATCVAIAPNLILTTRHQGVSLSDQICIAGENYSIDQIYTHSEADLAVARLKDANLEVYASLISSDPASDEIGTQVVMVGFGRGRLAELKSGSVTYGYAWDSNSNTNLRWCTNKIKSTRTLRSSEFTCDLLTADFSGPDDPDCTEFEGSLAWFDSGGGWFIQENGNWSLAGISRGVERIYESWFRENEQPCLPDPDRIDCIQIRPCRSWIQGIIQENSPNPADLNGDYKTSVSDMKIFALFWLSECNSNQDCTYVDYIQDNQINNRDLSFLLSHWSPDS